MGTDIEDRRIDRDSDEPVTSDSPNAITARAEGASLIQVNQLSNMALAFIIFAMFLSVAVGAIGIAIGLNAKSDATHAATQAALARNHADDALRQIVVLRDVLKIVGLPIEEPEDEQ